MLSDVLSDFKLLGVVISLDLTWDAHVSYILSKSSKRIYCILNLCKAGVRRVTLFTFNVQLLGLF